MENKRKLVAHLNPLYFLIFSSVIVFLLFLSFFIIPSNSASNVPPLISVIPTIAPFVGSSSNNPQLQQEIERHNTLMKQIQSDNAKTIATESRITNDTYTRIKLMFWSICILLLLYMLYLWFNNRIILSENQLQIKIRLGTLLFGMSYGFFFNIQSWGLKNEISTYHNTALIDIKTLKSIHVFKPFTLVQSALLPKIQYADRILFVYLTSSHETHGVIVNTSDFPFLRNIIHQIQLSNPSLLIQFHNTTKEK